jgi:uroporphyrinogen III methyltransferase / synthase
MADPNVPTPDLERTRKPLLGLRVLVTRPEGQSAELAGRLQELGAIPVICPTIRIVGPESFEALDRAITDLSAYDWVIFTSVNGVRFFFERLPVLGYGVEEITWPRLAAIGPATAAALAEHGLQPALVPAKYVAEAILDEIGDVAGQRILLPRADIARKALAEGLQSRGAHVDEVAAYRTVGAGQDLPAGPVDIATFTSPSTVRNFVGLLEAAGRDAGAYLGGARVACIGPITAQAAAAEGLPVDIEASEHTVPGLLQAVILYWEQGAK